VSIARGVLCAACVLVCAGCGPRMDLGSDVLWSSDLESGDLSEWASAPGGGPVADPVGGLIEVAAGLSHSGTHAIKLTNSANMDSDGPGVYRELARPGELYYSIWYYLPSSYTTISQWTIQKFRTSSPTPDVLSENLDLNLRSLPGGQLALYVFSHDPQYLQAPLGDPVPFVPIARWFQIEVLFRPAADTSGSLVIFLDGKRVYDLENRRTAGGSDIFWTPCNIGTDVEPMPAVIYLDDAAISQSRVGPQGVTRK
jgi:hypothetical protein